MANKILDPPTAGVGFLNKPDQPDFSVEFLEYKLREREYSFLSGKSLYKLIPQGLKPALFEFHPYPLPYCSIAEETKKNLFDLIDPF